MPIGDINFQTFTIGSLDVNDSTAIGLVGLNIYEDILNPLGPVGEARLNDFNDAVGKSNINGKEDVTISFSCDQGGGSASFKFKLMKNTNGNDGSMESKGSGHSKRSDFRFVSPELLASQGNFISKSYNTQTSEMVKNMLTDFLKTDKSVDIQEQTKGNRRLVFHNEHFADAYKKLNHEHVSSSHESSCYVLFVQGGSSPKYVFSTYEQLFEQSPVTKLTQSTTLATGNISDKTKQNSMIWFKPSDTFFTPARSLTKPNEKTYNLTTGKAHSVPPQQPPSFKFADGQGVFTTPPSSANGVPSHTVNDPSNNKDDPSVSTARKNRAAFLAFLSQNSAELEIPGNPEITLGSMIELDVPKKANQDTEQGESQINGKALVVSIRHKIKPLGQTPRYTMVLRVVKGSYKQGGGGNG